jgi:hypothetical protein
MNYKQRLVELINSALTASNTRDETLIKLSATALSEHLSLLPDNPLPPAPDAPPSDNPQQP